MSFQLQMIVFLLNKTTKFTFVFYKTIELLKPLGR